MTVLGRSVVIRFRGVSVKPGEQKKESPEAKILVLSGFRLIPRVALRLLDGGLCSEHRGGLNISTNEWKLFSRDDRAERNCAGPCPRSPHIRAMGGAANRLSIMKAGSVSSGELSMAT
jgi:hypothetical protein